MGGKTIKPVTINSKSEQNDLPTVSLAIQALLIHYACTSDALHQMSGQFDKMAR